MILSVSIMAHPKRAAAVSKLRMDLGVDAVLVGWDTEGPPTRDADRTWRTARRAWDLYSPSADWHVLLQDDAIVPEGFLGALGGALAHVPAECIVSLYAGRTRPMSWRWDALAARADDAGASWVVSPRSLWGVALALPTVLIPDLLAWGDRQHGIPDDMRVGRWGMIRRLETWYSWPSMVDHPDEGSLTGHGGGRTARRFIGPSAVGATFDGPVVR